MGYYVDAWFIPSIDIYLVVDRCRIFSTSDKQPYSYAVHFFVSESTTKQQYTGRTYVGGTGKDVSYRTRFNRGI